ncbi:hypothetical protein KA013_01940 [Patescibacteria group bacterium]|nr:hypothetical protein [Patescibacteria group bacterium]
MSKKSKKEKKAKKKAKALISASKVVSTARGQKEVASKIKAKVNTKAPPLKAAKKKKTGTTKTIMVKGKPEKSAAMQRNKPLKKIIARPG